MILIEDGGDPDTFQFVLFRFKCIEVKIEKPKQDPDKCEVRLEAQIVATIH